MNYKAEYEKWLDSPALSEREWKELHDIRNDEKEIENRFFAPLDFGTAGLRGTMKVGLHHMNIHIIRHATQAFANVIAAEGEEAMAKGIVICHDCRLNGVEFAKEAACVMAANGIHVRLFDALRPTPELSFAVRYYGTAAGLNITASHNPKEYNGYKVYWSDGAQLPPKQADEIAQQMAQIDIFTGFKSMDFDEAKAAGFIEILGSETDEAFLDRVLGQAIDKEVVKRVADDFHIVYTPFHGTGHKLVPEALKRLGIKHINCVPEQMVIDGAFPTVASPNPENPEGFYLAVDLAKEVDSDIIIGTDPDADRIGVMVRQGGKDEYVGITGNQLGVLLLDYVINAKLRTGTMPANPAALKTIVTTEMAREVCERNGVYTVDTFTGFKFMAEKIAEWEAEGSYECIFAYEESYGYLMGDYVRDKDAVTASMMVAEMAAYYYEKGMSLKDALDGLYEKYGNFAEKTLNLVMPGLDGLQKMAALMARLRAEPLAEICGVPVVKMRDYKTGDLSVSGLGVVGKTHISGSNVLYYELADGSSFIVRPSGTEPKVKVYLLVRDENQEKCAEKIAKYTTFAESLKD
ncbi:MAG: phospho-sugar mutase [Oscillospiraceae bacterium]|nr:phospho-sugar mutase [Oscillospiraceae bacterium]